MSWALEPTFDLSHACLEGIPKCFIETLIKIKDNITTFDLKFEGTSSEKECRIPEFQALKAARTANKATIKYQIRMRPKLYVQIVQISGNIIRIGKERSFKDGLKKVSVILGKQGQDWRVNKTWWGRWKAELKRIPSLHKSKQRRPTSGENKMLFFFQQLIRPANNGTNWHYIVAFCVLVFVFKAHLQIIIVMYWDVLHDIQERYTIHQARKKGK